jgi:hypothetical protein
MAPTHNAVAVYSTNLDAQLAQRTAMLMGSLRPRRRAEQVVAELLDQLKVEKLDRESRGLNHWGEHAPRFLRGLILQARAEKRRRHQEAAGFFKAKRREVLSFARAVVGDTAAAEIVAAETYRELLEGGTTTGQFFMALVANARNYLARQAYQREKVDSLEEAFCPQGGSPEELGGEDGEIEAFEPPSHRFDDQDPLDILIAREDEAERQILVAAAKQDPRWRFIKRKKWAQPLLENVPI